MEEGQEHISYESYIQSEDWKRKRQERLDFAMYCCELCSSPNEIEVHHRTYKNLGDERLNDMIVLCKICHSIFHRRLGLYGEDVHAYRKVEHPLNEDLREVLPEIEAIHGERGFQGLPIGYTAFDNLTGGLQRGTVTIVAGRPGMGVTSFVLGVARNVALHPEHSSNVLYVTAEMMEIDVAQRLLTMEGRIDSIAARTGKLSDDDWPRLARAAGRLSLAPIFIHTAPHLTLEMIRKEVRAQCRSFKAGLIIIDSLQAIEVPELSRQWREAQVNEIMRVLKGLAIDLSVSIIITSRVNRTAETRGGEKRPWLSDLGEDSIVSEADNIVFIYRPERYGITVDEYGNSTEGLADIMVAKQRNGPIGTIQLAFVHQFARFANLVAYHPESSQESTSLSSDAPS